MHKYDNTREIDECKCEDAADNDGRLLILLTLSIQINLYEIWKQFTLRIK